MLKALRYLYNRMELSEEERKYLYSLKKGYEGEVMFDSLTEKVQSESYILHDLLLEINNTEFQIDSSLISQAKMFLFEVKNNDGEHFYKADSDKFYKYPDKEITNPLHQVSRKENLLRQFLKYHGFHLPIEPYVIFIHPEFTLWQAPISQIIILPTQLKQLMKKLNNIPSKLGLTHKKLAERLVAAHKQVSSHKHELRYEYGKLKKGVTCCKCNSFEPTVCGNKLVCKICEEIELIEVAVLRCVEEIRVLFPEIKITTNVVHEWCQLIDSKKMISRILKKHLKPNGYGQWTYYE